MTYSKQYAVINFIGGVGIFNTREERNYQGARELTKTLFGSGKTLLTSLWSGLSVIKTPDELTRALLETKAANSMEEAQTMLDSLNGKRLKRSDKFHDLLLFEKVINEKGDWTYKISSYKDIDS